MKTFVKMTMILTLLLSALLLMTGCSKELPTTERCSRCSGNGICVACNGNGYNAKTGEACRGCYTWLPGKCMHCMGRGACNLYWVDEGRGFEKRYQCTYCYGFNGKCRHCNGTGQHGYNANKPCEMCYGDTLCPICDGAGYM